MAEKLSDRMSRIPGLGKLLFVSDEPGIVSSEPKEVDVQGLRTEPAHFNPSSTSGVSAPTGFYTPQTTKNIDPETREKVVAIVNGVDQVSFTKFSDVKKSLANGFGSNEAGLYGAALAAVKAFGIPPEEVLRGLDAILHELAQVEGRFKEAVPQRLAAKVGARREKISQLQQTVSSKKEEMRRIEESLSRLRTDITQLSQTEQSEQAAISEDEKGVREDTDRFLAALESVREPYLAERQKVSSYRKGV